jgi:hypothetical protein
MKKFKALTSWTIPTDKGQKTYNVGEEGEAEDGVVESGVKNKVCEEITAKKKSDG